MSLSSNVTSILIWTLMQILPSKVQHLHLRNEANPRSATTLLLISHEEETHTQTQPE